MTKLSGKIIVLAVAAGLFASGAIAEAETYECKFRVPGRDIGSLSKTIIIHLDDFREKALIDNPLASTESRKKVYGKVVTDNRKQLTLRWELANIVDGGGTSYARVRYRVTIWKATGRAVVSAQMPTNTIGQGGNAGNMRPGGEGKCALR